MRHLQWLAVVWCTAGTVLYAQGAGEYEIKAAFLYNFVRLVEWPADAPAGPIRICVAGPQAFEAQLDATVQGEAIGGRPVTVSPVSQLEPGCHVLFVPSRADATRYLRAANGRPVLTVGESPDFIGQGGIINFVIEQNRVRFEINPGAAMRANLRISSRLLQLARIRQS